MVISGKLIVHFTVDKEGIAGNHHVKDLLGYGLDDEAIRVIKLIPNLWLPALKDGESIDSESSYPITYRLQTQQGVR